MSFPAHCSHKMQPLDRSVYGPFKHYVNMAVDDWMRTHPGKTMTIYDIPAIVREALPLAISCKNIMAGFACTGIYPFNQNIFAEADFAPGYVTDRPNPTEPERAVDVVVQEDLPESYAANEVVEYPSRSPSPKPSTSVQDPRTPSPRPGTSACAVAKATLPRMNSMLKVTPESIRPLPKAEARKPNVRTTRRKRVTAILTDTPVKNTLAELKKKPIKKPKKRPELAQKQKVTKIIKQAATSSDDSADEEEVFCLVCGEPWSKSKPKEEWVKCTNCRLWAHSKCAGGQAVFYVCVNCNSDDDL